MAVSEKGHFRLNVDQFGREILEVGSEGFARRHAVRQQRVHHFAHFEVMMVDEFQSSTPFQVANGSVVGTASSLLSFNGQSERKRERESVQMIGDHKPSRFAVGAPSLLWTVSIAYILSAIWHSPAATFDFAADTLRADPPMSVRPASHSVFSKIGD